MKSASRKEKYEYQKGRNDEESNETLESLSCDDRLSLVVLLMFYTADAASPRKHRHHPHHPKRGVIVVHRFASTDQVRTDSSIFNISLAMAESLHNNDYS